MILVFSNEHDGAVLIITSIETSKITNVPLRLFLYFHHVSRKLYNTDFSVEMISCFYHLSLLLLFYVIIISVNFNNKSRAGKKSYDIVLILLHFSKISECKQTSSKNDA